MTAEISYNPRTGQINISTTHFTTTFNKPAELAGGWWGVDDTQLMVSCWGCKYVKLCDDTGKCINSDDGSLLPITSTSKFTLYINGTPSPTFSIVNTNQPPRMISAVRPPSMTPAAQPTVDPLMYVIMYADHEPGITQDPIPPVKLSDIPYTYNGQRMMAGVAGTVTYKRDGTFTITGSGIRDGTYCMVVNDMGITGAVQTVTVIGKSITAFSGNPPLGVSLGRLIYIDTQSSNVTSVLYNPENYLITEIYTAGPCTIP